MPAKMEGSEHVEALIAAARQAQAEYARDQRDATARILAAAAQGNGAVTAADIRQRQAP